MPSILEQGVEFDICGYTGDILLQKLQDINVDLKIEQIDNADANIEDGDKSETELEDNEEDD